MNLEAAAKIYASDLAAPAVRQPERIGEVEASTKEMATVCEKLEGNHNDLKKMVMSDLKKLAS